ncbi:hypothetical protein [Paenibacillus graminis]|uniref:Uncharacterized protein n=1 Tax=Paenibacillus graminis TaxID=189425 RepID=A0A089M844_9BACL|nr:hypothetical protein [Paenibacillus graminis]AIQ69956.1 hypothetical protein PGRAT_21665 [Paenibacillus graminis]
MLEFVLFMVFSVLETYAMFYLAFKVFKIDFYHKEMIFAGCIMGFFSYVIRVEYHLVEIDIIVQYLLIFCFFWMLFRIHFFYAAILTGMTYQAYTFIQLMYIVILDKAGLFSAQAFYGIDIDTNLLQILSSTTALGIGYYSGRRRKGFDFIPDKPNGLIKTTKREKFLFVLNLPTAGLIIFIMHLFNSNYFLAAPLIYAFLLFCYIYLAYSKDRSGHEYIKL